MVLIPESHPRAESLRIRERLVSGFERGLVAPEGLLAEGRGEAFDYLLGERTGRAARAAIDAAAARLLLAARPVISVNGNAAALCPKEMVMLANMVGAKLEVNLFYSDEKRRQKVAETLKKNGAAEVLGTDGGRLARLSGIDSARRAADKEGIIAADVVVVPLEDGDRTAALASLGKGVIAFDLNPMSRTAQAAEITIVDNLVRAMPLLVESCGRMSKRNSRELEETIESFDNKKNLSDCIADIRDNLTRRSQVA